MRLKLIVPLVLLASSPGHAQSSDVQGYCAAIGKFARTVMQGRQAGAAMESMMTSKAPSPAFQELGRTLITAAFREPVADTEELKQQAINKFESTTVSVCNDAGGNP